MSCLGRILLGLVLGAFLLSFIAIAALWISMQGEQRSWRSVPCVVEKSALLVEREADLAGRHWTPMTRYELDVVYRYEVDGTTHVGGTYSQVNSWLWKSAAAEALREVPAGARTTCLIDPGYPSSSVLRLETSYAAVVFLAVLALLPLVGLWMLADMPEFWRRRRDRVPRAGIARRPR